MNKSIFLILIFILGVMILDAQETNDYAKFRIRVSGWPTYSPKAQGKKYGYINSEFSYRFNKLFEAGFSTGIYQDSKFEKDAAGNILANKHLLMHFGPHANLHLIPFFINNPKLRFDFYLAGKAGWKQYYPAFENRKLANYYFIGAGASYFFTRNLGLYAEYGFKKASVQWINGNDASEFRLGLVLKFL